MSKIGTVIYNTFLKRTSTFVLTIMVGSFIFERAFDLATDTMFDSINKGKQWKDIKHKYETN